MNNRTREVVVDGHSLTIDEAIHVSGISGNSLPKVIIDTDKLEQLRRTREALMAKVPIEHMYGVNTGCGSNKNRIIPIEDIVRYQAKYIPVHACGSGDFLPAHIVRTMILCRLNSLLWGASALSIELIERLADLLNHDIVPLIPSFGSVGASGDLIPLAHLGMVLGGIDSDKVMVIYDSEKMTAAQAFAMTGLKFVELGPKEAMGLTNGATLILAQAIHAVDQAENLLATSNVALALGLEAIRGERNAFDPRIHNARGFFGQLAVAEQVLQLLNGSKRTTREAQKEHFFSETDPRDKGDPRIQDAYSFRCAPQVHGSVTDSLGFVRQTVETELNAATDNPLIFENEDGSFDVLSGGNFHGEPLAHALDLLAIVMASLAGISDRRTFRLINSELSYGLPQDLSGTDASDNTGFMIAQYGGASRVTHTKILAAPASVDSIPTSGNQEDYVSMGSISAHKVLQQLPYVTTVLATEILIACQGIDLGAEKLGDLAALGEGTQKAYDLVRQLVTQMGDDRWLYPDLQAVEGLIKSGKFKSL